MDPESRESGICRFSSDLDMVSHGLSTELRSREYICVVNYSPNLDMLNDRVVQLSVMKVPKRGFKAWLRA